MQSIVKILAAQREFFKTGKTREIDFRIQSLKKLSNAIKKYEKRFCEAIYADLHKAEFETYATEIGMVSKETKLHLKNVKKWAKPTKVITDMLNFGSKSMVIHEPYGVVLLMSPWNYPLQTCLTPLAGAVSAGNCVVIKPAHYSEHTTEAIKDLITETFDPEYISVFTGDRKVNQALLEQRYDYIFFTGSTFLGRLVMEKAAKHLTPCTLELGGKSPVIVEPDANISVAAQRIAFGKFINAGQTCIAPDHLFVHRDIKAKLLAKIIECVKTFHGEDPEKSPDFGRIINDAQFSKLDKLIHSAGTIVHGGRLNKKTRYISPTIIDNIKLSDPIMQEEIFGPVLPVIEYTSLQSVIDSINDREKPLAMYFFSSSRKKRDLLFGSTSSGGACFNDIIMHTTNHRMPFGGVGFSGMGAYHGKFTFDTFSHHRSLLDKPTLFNPTLAYPPYKNKLKFVKPFIT